MNVGVIKVAARLLPPLCAALLFIAASSTPTAAQHGPTTLAYQLTHVDMAEPFPSPDGKKLVFEMTFAGFEQLFTMNTDGSSQIQLTHDAANHDSPAWSPDGRKIAYVSDKTGHEAIYMMNADGTGEERLTDSQHEYIHPNWSPDSTKLIYCTDDDLHPPKKNSSEIYSLDLKTREAMLLITGGTNTYPSWSPDARQILFRKMIGETNSEIFVANSDGSGARNLTNHPAFDGWPVWSPDGAQIAFATNRGVNYQIFIMKADGSGARLLANTEGRATEPRWSTDGKTVYFSNCRNVDWGTDCHVFAAQVQQAVPPHP
jgi:TolB protein